MTHFIDLDAVARPDIRVGLGGAEYTLPGDVKVPTMLRLIELDRLSKTNDEDAAQEAIHDLYAEVLSLFQVHQPDLEELPISFEQIGELFGQLLTVYTPAEDDKPRPTPRRPATTRRKNGKPSASRRKRPKARSASSTS